jgi:polysaccharide pyruvyl transferase WcaK-like protein
MLNQKFEHTTFICGGDQIWNPACQDFEPAYYLEFLKGSPAKKISYSASLGKTEFRQEELNDICKWVQKFDSISVREEQGAALIQKMVSIPVSVVCDPVLLLERKYWDQISQKPKYKKPYILCYFLDNNHGDRSLIPYLKEKTGYDVVMLNEYIRDFIKPYHHAYDTSPEEFVGLFKHAAFIYTNSFHGTVFATIFQKPFLTAIAKNQKAAVNNNDSRKIDYLKRIGLENRLVTLGGNMERILSPIDWGKASVNMEDFREQSMNYLKRALMRK